MLTDTRYPAENKKRTPLIYVSHTITKLSYRIIHLFRLMFLTRHQIVRGLHRDPLSMSRASFGKLRILSKLDLTLFVVGLTHSSPSKVHSSLTVSVSQRWMVSSKLPLAIRLPSGMKAAGAISVNSSRSIRLLIF